MVKSYTVCLDTYPWGRYIEKFETKEQAIDAANRVHAIYTTTLSHMLAGYPGVVVLEYCEYLGRYNKVVYRVEPTSSTTP